VTLAGEVHDTGPGIDPAQADRLFTPFGQTEVGRRAGGAGLGLSICRQLVEKMGGEIGVDSRLGEGSIFRFEVLVSAVAEPAARSPDPLETPTQTLDSPHVLVVDDNATNRLVAETLLDMMGCTFSSVENGLLAVERVRAEPFDLVLMDVKMPVMDGLEATRRIRAMPGPAGAVPIIALTANADPLDAETYRREGMDAVVEKPIKAEQLLSAMARLLEEADQSVAA
jgi:CheY-like chemotaxis protein